MSIQTIQSDLLADLSTDEQELLSGGVEYRVRGLRNAFIRYRGERRPVDVEITVDLPRRGGGGGDEDED